MKEWFNEKITNARVLDLSIEVYRKKLKSLIGYQLLFALTSILIVGAGGLVLFPMLSLFKINGTFGFICFLTIMFIGMTTFICMSKAGIFHMVYSYVNDDDLSASDALGKAFSSFGPSIRLATALGVCLLPIMIIMSTMGVTAANFTILTNKLNSLTFFGIMMRLFLYSLIGAVIGSYLFYSLHIAIFDKGKGFESIKKSIQFAKDEVLKNAFRVLSIMLFDWGVKLSIYSAIGAISTLLYFLLGKIDVGGSIVSQMITYSTLAQPVVNFILLIFLTPIAPIMWTLYYVNMKYKKEGFKISNMLNALNQQQTVPAMQSVDLNKE
ncbi:hypothetical protein [Marinisporobacter balticus]|uniref:Glycerophosphoryl diester phosphodiesterase family protein n=1 Tax=Marinisporobacter balticus TaxID=2018667 RepID=A0A4R2KWH2_9FIRM|nr:hypothetical protein [Marinisporobacter balticus]TCO74588.1 hypothetical protein EV214_11267 [Marinisporobacter balticus]